MRRQCTSHCTTEVVVGAAVTAVEVEMVGLEGGLVRVATVAAEMVVTMAEVVLVEATAAAVRVVARVEGRAAAMMVVVMVDT